MLEQLKRKKGKPNVQRFKGLGEMNPMQLRETTLDPNTRRLVQLVISDEDEQQTTAIMDMLLAKSVRKIVATGCRRRAIWRIWKCKSVRCARRKGSLRLPFHGITESADLNASLQNTDAGLQHIAFDRFRPGLHVRGLQVCFKMRDAFPLLDHDDRVGRCGLEADAGGMIHHRGIAVAAGLLQNGRNNFRELIENRPAVVLARRVRISAITVNMVNSTPSVWILSYSGSNNSKYVEHRP
nr:DNA topoisomerase 4 subunit B [Klebsiella pneumoniae]